MLLLVSLFAQSEGGLPAWALPLVGGGAALGGGGLMFVIRGVKVLQRIAHAVDNELMPNAGRSIRDRVKTTAAHTDELAAALAELDAANEDRAVRIVRALERVEDAVRAADDR